jgi:radical SAM protein with 4Fe4S-binding SPASM domain
MKMVGQWNMIYRAELPKPFTPDLPEIYQLEVSSVCNLECTMCPRTKFERSDKTALLSLDLLKKLIKEDSFKGSYFVELQMAGEPLIHPLLYTIVSLLQGTGVKVGLSTNGILINLELQSLLELDYLTISVDSITGYEKLRVKGKVQKLIDNIKLFLDKNKKTVVDLQIIELPGWEGQLELLKELFPTVNIRTVKDCFMTIFQEVDALPVSGSLCINPWISCSIQCNGNVVPCCFSFWDDIVYGNVNDRTLKDIWNGSEVKQLRNEHQSKNYRTICARCYMRSPAFLHTNIFNNSIRSCNAI